jgi:hypothetical protein
MGFPLCVQQTSTLRLEGTQTREYRRSTAKGGTHVCAKSWDVAICSVQIMNILTVSLQGKVHGTFGGQCKVNRAVDNMTVMWTIWGGTSVPKQEKTYKYVLLVTKFAVNSNAENSKHYLISKRITESVHNVHQRPGSAFGRGEYVTPLEIPRRYFDTTVYWRELIQHLKSVWNWTADTVR